MRRGAFVLFFVGCLALSLGYLELRFSLVSSTLKGPMTEQEKSAYIVALHDGMLDKKEEIVLSFRGDSEEMQQFAADSIEEAFRLDDLDTSSDYDYMKYVHKVSHINMSGWGNVYTITYSMEYLESAEETRIVDKRIKKILKKLISKDMKDYAKVKAIHDYVVDHVTYDMSTSQNSAYYALIDGSSACQGYATLVYKMLTEAGIPCRVITGTGKDGLHAWNLVKVGKKWYNLDATWDDPVGAFVKKSSRYTYFLKSDAEFKDHIRDPEFTTEEFKQEYPVAKKSYQ